MDRNRTGLMAASIAILAPGAALAQDAPPPSVKAETPQDAGLGDIVVTAQKRSESIQKVPIAITALTGDQLGTARVNTVSNLANQVPSLTVQSPFADAIPIFSLRGVSTSDYSQNQSSPVAIYVDEVYKGAAVLTSLQVFDVDRVEVLRGPQGTLYGKNTTGGAINFYTVKPDLTGGISGYVSAGIGNYSRYETSGAINIPVITDVLAVRAAFTYAKQDGFIKNTIGKNLESIDDFVGRLSIAFKPTDRLTFNLRASASRSKPTGFSTAPTDVQPGGVAGSGYFPTGLGYYESSVIRPGFQRVRNQSVALTTNWDLSDRVALTAVTAYDHGTWPSEFNPLGTPIDLAHGIFYSKATAFQQDLRLASIGNGRYKWLIGAFYYRDRVQASVKYQFFYGLAGDNNGNGQLDCFDDGITGCAYSNDLDQVRESMALYTQQSYEIADKLTITGGLRYTRDINRLDSYKSYLSYFDPATGREVQNVQEIISAPLPGNDYRKNENLGGKIGIEYQATARTLLYANVSRAYRGASFNGQAIFDPRGVTVTEPERVDAYELGLKTQVLDDRLRFNGALFHYAYKNQQFLDTREIGGVPISVLINAPKSRIWGAEAEVMAKPTAGVELRLGASYLDAKFTEATLLGVNLAGNRLIQAPETTLNMGADWTVLDTGGLSVKVHGSGRYTSRLFFNAENNPLISQPGYWIADGGVTLGLLDDRLHFDGWVKNVTGTHYYSYMEDNLAGFGIVAARRGRPREYGITARMTF